MRYFFRFILATMMIIANFSVRATDVATASSDLSLQTTHSATPIIVPHALHYDQPDNTMPLISVNTDSALDLNWSAALELAEPALRPVPLVLPFFTGFPISNLEIKLRVLNLKF